MLTILAACDILNKSLRYVSENKINAIVAQLVEYNLAKVGVAGSSPVYRSFFMLKKGRIEKRFSLFLYDSECVTAYSLIS